MEILYDNVFYGDMCEDVVMTMMSCSHDDA
jgi:hypothetical protein